MALGGSINTDVLHDETFDLLCTMCEQKGRNREAEKYCVECGDYYCLSCVTVHDEVPALKRHKILDKGKFPSRSLKASSRSGKKKPMAPTERCDRHSHHFIDMYCKNHHDVGCGTCMAVDHRTCKDIYYIPEFLQTNSTVTPANTTLYKLESVASTIKAYYENFQREIQQLTKRKTSTLEHILKYRKEINTRLDELEKNTVTDIEVRYKALISKLKEDMAILETNRANIQSARDNLVTADNNMAQNFVNATKGTNIANKAENCLELSKAKLPTESIDFKPDLRLSSLLQELSALGNVTQKVIKKIQQAKSFQQQGLVDKTEKSKYHTINTEQEALLQLKAIKKYCVRVQSDERKCEIVSACTLEDGTILLSDNSNKKLKRLDSSTYRVIDYCDLPGQPWQVCSINKHQAAVCLFDKQGVHFIPLSNRMTLTHRNKITIDFNCLGLAYADGNLYISDYTSVYIYSVSGEKLKQFSKDQSGHTLFSDIRSLAVSEDGSRIYVPDYDKGLIILDNNGKVVGKYNGPQLKGAYDSYLTGRGSLLVCGKYSKNVLQFGLDGELIGEVVQYEDDAYRKAICCNQQLSKMIIGMYDDEIEVYDL